MKPHDESEPFFITEDVAAELTAAGYEFVPPGCARTASTRDLFGKLPDETLSEVVSRHLQRADTGSGREPRGEGV